MWTVKKIEEWRKLCVDVELWGNNPTESAIDFLLTELANKERETAEKCCDISDPILRNYTTENWHITNAIRKHFGLDK